MGAKLLIVFLAAATSCHKHYFGTSYDLSTQGRVIAWPVDERGDKFRYTIDHLPTPLREGRIYDLAVGNGPIRAKLPEPVDSVLVVLPPEPEPGQRKAAERVVDWVVDQDGGAAAHIIVGFEPWTFVLNVGQLEQSLAKVEERTADRLAKSGSSWELDDEAFVQVAAQMMAQVWAPFIPSFVVVPVQGRQGSFAVLQADMSEEHYSLVAHTKTAEEAAGYALAHYDGEQFRSSEYGGFEFQPTLHFLLARDAPQALREECAAAAQRLSTRIPAGHDRPFLVVFRTTSLEQVELNKRGMVKTLTRSGDLIPFGHDTKGTE